MNLCCKKQKKCKTKRFVLKKCNTNEFVLQKNKKV